MASKYKKQVLMFTIWDSIIILEKTSRMLVCENTYSQN